MFTTSNMQSSNLVSYRTSVEQKIKAKNVAHALLNHVKNGSPKVKKLIREQCRVRIKEARRRSFEQSRKLHAYNKDLLLDVLRTEVAEFENDIELHDLIFKEILEDSENWFIEELENELKNQENYLVQICEEDVPFCPICEKSQLKLNEKKVTCVCGISFVYNKSLDEFVKEIQNIIQDHEIKCEKDLSFYIEPNLSKNISATLSCLCFDCDYFRNLD